MNQDIKDIKARITAHESDVASARSAFLHALMAVERGQSDVYRAAVRFHDLAPHEAEGIARQAEMVGVEVPFAPQPADQAQSPDSPGSTGNTGEAATVQSPAGSRLTAPAAPDVPLDDSGGQPVVGRGAA